jgi:hypothetical protein
MAPPLILELGFREAFTLGSPVSGKTPSRTLGEWCHYSRLDLFK